MEIMSERELDTLLVATAAFMKNPSLALELVTLCSSITFIQQLIQIAAKKMLLLRNGIRSLSV